jgi:hypothetical protein
MYSPRRLDTTLLHYTHNGFEHSISLAELIAAVNFKDSDGELCVFEDFVFDDDGNKM